jgi:hypothetical protein
MIQAEIIPSEPESGSYQRREALIWENFASSALVSLREVCLCLLERSPCW